METPILSAKEGIASAAALLKQESIVALPTETVYGLAGDAFSSKALASIFKAKERPLSDPLIIHLLDISWLDRVVTLTPELEQIVLSLAAAFWPGPLTLLLPRHRAIPDLVTAGLETVALRIPSHPIFRKVLALVGTPLAAPSANRFGRISPTRASDVLMELQGKIPLILDGGPCQHGLESTILWPQKNLSTPHPPHNCDSEDLKAEYLLQILRPGPITSEMLAPWGHVIAQSEKGKAPGSLQSHYAPRKKLLWYRSEALPQKNVGLLSFSKKIPGFGANEILSPTGNLLEAAANLYGALRRLDESSVDYLLVEPLSEDDLGFSIMDRLKRAVSII